MQKSGFPKVRHYVGFWQIGSHIIRCHFNFWKENFGIEKFGKSYYLPNSPKLAFHTKIKYRNNI